MAGARSESNTITYPRDDAALRHGAGVETETQVPREAYAPFPRWNDGPPDELGRPAVERRLILRLAAVVVLVLGAAAATALAAGTQTHAVNPKALPLGDGHVTHLAEGRLRRLVPDDASAASAARRRSGRGSTRPAKTWDRTKKLSVQGAVKWPQARYASEGRRLEAHVHVQRPADRPRDGHVPDRERRPGVRVRPQPELDRRAERDLERAAEPEGGREAVVHADGADRRAGRRRVPLQRARRRGPRRRRARDARPLRRPSRPVRAATTTTTSRAA